MTITNQNQTYQPTGDDHLIYEWVKMQGKTQAEVASMFGINQSTVSRILQRVERWQAHAKARENGRLDPKERLRAQRLLRDGAQQLLRELLRDGASEWWRGESGGDLFSQQGLSSNGGNCS